MFGNSGVIALFSVIGIILNAVIFRRGAKVGCAGLVLGFFGMFMTLWAAPVVGFFALVGLGFMAFGKSRSVSIRSSNLEEADWIANRTAAAQSSARPYAAQVSQSNPLADMQVADYMGADLDTDVYQIEEDFIEGRINRETYVARRRALIA